MLEIADRQTITQQALLASFPQLCGMQTDSVVAFALRYGWLNRCGSELFFRPTGRGQELLSAGHYQEKLRLLILHYVVTENPIWAINAKSGRARTISACSLNVRQMLYEAGVETETTKEAIDFWDYLATRSRNSEVAQNLSVGRAGERLSMRYEMGRVGRPPRWVAVESNCDGYDVLSLRAQNDARLLAIEVKSSSLGLEGVFHVTRNEWETACRLEAFLFHLWDLRTSANLRLAVLPPERIQPHVPKDQLSGCWESFCLDFHVFKNDFVDINAELLGSLESV